MRRTAGFRMNYYRRYVGDYLKKTSRLSMIEHGAYTLLLDYYYADEKPLPLDKDELYTMVRAMSLSDRKAVDKVLCTFFCKQEDGYHNKRADHEIEVSQKARTNGKSGGRPASESKTGTLTGSQTDVETGEITETETGTLTGSGHPLTTNLKPPSASLKPPTANHEVEPLLLEPSPQDSRDKSHSPNGRRNSGKKTNGQTQDDSPVVALIPLIDGSDFEVRQKIVTELGEAYPAIDVPLTLREIRAWCITNPKNRKTTAGVLRFLNNWLKREQDRAPPGAH